MCRCDVEKVYKRKAEDRLKEQNNINERERERESALGEKTLDMCARALTAA